ncbi:MAG: preprotein translocase subunit YajC [Proteobacteria bacterium]|nr:preprotein translocase subunit YajC [Pseudomonadota bacterium]
MIEFFINNAWAQGASQEGGSGSFLLMMVGFFAIFYFLLIRPQTKQAKEHKQLIASLSKGDEVVTTGGMLGRVNKVGDSFILLEISKELEVKIQKSAVSIVMPKGTIKTL